MEKDLAARLRDVSRSFYLTLRVLPGRIRPQIGLAYLLARATDTIADTELVPPAERLDALRAFRERIAGTDRPPLNFGELAKKQASDAERLLLKEAETYVVLLEGLAPADALLVRQVLEVITGGQDLDLRRFLGASRENVIALKTEAELDDYTYRVAGCVGEFWTRICRAHLFPKAALDEELLLQRGVRFGKGLQLTNILRDLAADLAQGRCYLPSEALTAAGLAPAELLQPEVEPRLRPLYDGLLERAREHLRAGWQYTNMLPMRQVRVRLACAWPILIGLETLELLRTAGVLRAGHRHKISRARVKRLMWRSVLCLPSRSAWRNLAKF